MRKTWKLAGLVLAASLAAGAVAADGHTAEYVGNKGYIGDAGAKGYVGPVAAHSHPRGYLIIRHRSERRGSGPLYAVPGCPPGFNGMFRGTLYCVDGRPMG